MALSNNIKREIEKYLCKWIEALVEKKTIEFKKASSLNLVLKDSEKPFHEAILTEEIKKFASFERSFSTGLGSTFEEAARIIGKLNFKQSIRQHELKCTIPKDTNTEIERVVNGLPKRLPNYKDEVARMVEFAKNDKSDTVNDTIRSDLYLQSHDGNELFFEFKSPKPNKEQCMRITKIHLQIHCMIKKPFPQVQTYYGMAYNPNGEGKKYTHSFAKSYMDVENHVLMGKQLWDFIGGPDTYEDLLSVYEKAGDTIDLNTLKRNFGTTV